MIKDVLIHELNVGISELDGAIAVSAKMEIVERKKIQFSVAFCILMGFYGELSITVACVEAIKRYYARLSTQARIVESSSINMEQQERKRR